MQQENVNFVATGLNPPNFCDYDIFDSLLHLKLSGVNFTSVTI